MSESKVSETPIFSFFFFGQQHQENGEESRAGFLGLLWPFCMMEETTLAG